MATGRTLGVVTNEDCDLHYWYQGSGPLITFIPGGNGCGRQFFSLMGALSDRYTCVTFDRRQMSASKAKVNKRINPMQQVRDVLAIVKALGFEKSIFFGSSLGGLLAFMLAIYYPQKVEHLIAHEAPTYTLLRDADIIVDKVLSCLDVRDEQGVPAAAQAFHDNLLVGYDDDGVPPASPMPPDDAVNHWTNEIGIFSFPVPDLRRIVENGTSVGLMTGLRSRDVWYARATYEQEKILGCLRMDVPGHHQGFECEMQTFLPSFLQMLELLEQRKHGRS
ncbi:uncharacterized protein DNG_04730 [Cephalotrichum gorgonifer]|uniref:AB hydrolase-1 domain-containing protein n=1 Tax=Cephalotrichum gorgonifer TaxID=2041049 RepID=A0AAE8SVL3_9PEZI|nr:uncharacterized protein DNG_04730 [Cephalotrichum gorgonifer]